MNNIKKIWIYGCSFSEPFGLIPAHDIVIGPYNSRIFKGVDYWGTHLSKLLKIECITRSLSGVGWNYINNCIDEDIIYWDKNDFVIINPSFFSRVTIEELHKRDKFYNLMEDNAKDVEFICRYNCHRWCRKIETLNHLGYENVYSWLIDNYSCESNIYNLIPAPDGSYNWKHWMDKHLEYWIDPDFNPPHGDWHFNDKGHIAVANRIYEFIYEKIK
jgi:hypothetical protein